VEPKITAIHVDQERANTLIIFYSTRNSLYVAAFRSVEEQYSVAYRFSALRIVRTNFGSQETRKIAHVAAGKLLVPRDRSFRVSRSLLYYGGNFQPRSRVLPQYLTGYLKGGMHRRTREARISGRRREEGPRSLAERVLKIPAKPEGRPRRSNLCTCIYACPCVGIDTYRMYDPAAAIAMQHVARVAVASS